MTPLAAFVLAGTTVVALAHLGGAIPGRAIARSVRPTGPAPSPAPAWLAQLTEEAGWEGDPAALWRLGLPAAIIVLGGLALSLGPPSAAVAAVAAVAAPRASRRALRRRRLQRRDVLLGDFLERLASSLRSGHALGAAFAEVSASTPEPLAREVRAVATEAGHGAALADALDRWAGRPASSPAVVLAATALGLGVSTGGEIARSVDRVAVTLRERQELQSEARSLATQARASAGVLALAPIGFTVLVASVEPHMGRFLVTTPVGLACLVSGLGLEAAGALWMARIVRRAA